MSTSRLRFDIIMRRLTEERLRSYLVATGHSSRRALDLYDWNSKVAAALHADLGRLEVVFRNACDEALRGHSGRLGGSLEWWDRPALFPGRSGRRALSDVLAARQRAGADASRGKVVAELNFGFWRYLCEERYLTSLWVPALSSAFPAHPAHGDVRRVRSDVERRVQSLHFLRNRIAHHEPIHLRDLARDYRYLVEIVDWICPESKRWVVGRSAVPAALGMRPLQSPTGSVDGYTNGR